MATEDHEGQDPPSPNRQAARESSRPGAIRSRDDESRETIGIALSGGGSRAALYALGVLLYLVHSKLNNQVMLISSVSGGSIVNAALSLTKDYSRMSSREFERIAGRLARRLAHKGVFFFVGWRWVLLPTVIIYVFYLTVLITEFEILGGLPVVIWIVSALILLVLVLLALSAFLFTVWMFRGRTQRIRYAGLIAGFHPEVKGFRADRLKLGDITERTRVRHVLCATELTSGRPIYMDRREIRSPAYGSGEPNLALAKAIYASAAFPVGFPPLRVKTASLNMNGGDTEERPKWLYLSDGGVFNNLGTDSFTAWAKLDPFMPDQRFVNWPWPAITRRIVVNASSPGRLASMPRLWAWRNVVIVQRIMAVLYENTLRPRIETLLAEEEERRGPMIIDIANSPTAILERQKDIWRGKEDDRYKRAQETLEKLRKFQNTAYWHEYSVRASGTKTVLRAIGQTAAVRLLRLGYLDATIICHICLNSPGLEKVPSEAWFSGLVRNRVGSRKPLKIRLLRKARRSDMTQAAPSAQNERT